MDGIGGLNPFRPQNIQDKQEQQVSNSKRSKADILKAAINPNLVCDKEDCADCFKMIIKTSFR